MNNTLDIIRIILSILAGALIYYGYDKEKLSIALVGIISFLCAVIMAFITN